jgi:hypothetical protein
MLKYNESEYFNSEDYFLIKTNYNRFYVTKCHWYNGAWFSDESLKYKMSSVLSISCNELKNEVVFYKGTPLKGKIIKFNNPDGIGVLWDQGGKYKEFGLPYFWNKMEDLKIEL